MRRELNLLYSVSVMLGVVIGSGIFVSPVSIMFHCQSVGLSLIIWVLSGLLSLCIALCYVELACMFPKAGGEYAFFMEILPGRLVAFLEAWVHLVIINPAFYAVLALIAAQYLVQMFFTDCTAPDRAVKVLSIWILGKVFANQFDRNEYFLSSANALQCSCILFLLNGEICP